MGYSLDEKFRFYCVELMKAADEFHDSFEAKFDTYVNDRLTIDEQKQRFKDSEKRLLQMTECLAVIVNQHIGVPRGDAKQYVIDVILEGLFRNGKIALENNLHPERKLEYDTTVSYNDEMESSDRLLEFYARAYLIGTKSVAD